MRKLVLLLFTVVLFTSCKDQTERYTQSSPEIETLKASIDAYNTKNYETLISHHADSSRINFNRAKLNPSEVVEYHKRNDVAYSQRAFAKDGQIYEMVIDDEGKKWVNFWGYWHGTLAANSKELSIPVHLTAQFVDGKIVEQYGYWDPSEVLLALQEIEASKMDEDMASLEE
ncbi:nuclear transport factor 2 family protein [Mariniflexile sp. AS56]|uniref:nuclear transport factor 2 family protein n=1 Tax=Mariniflexile sp. AS56 TaxID=3063957 RepID=UPI0026EBEA71|nr:nuclear transport factor 2 family protein [Mariniflexile sp. AS56]MDO7173598.1 nuclear transport factor 2 family protein [Mariniflexile sp. AS56]